MRTTTVDTYCSFTGDAALHGTISVTISGLSLDSGNVHTLQLCAIGEADELAAASSVTILAGTATADITLESAALIAWIGARREVNAQLYLWDATDTVPAWNGQIKVRWAPAPTGYVVTSPDVTAITAAAASALVAAHSALDTGAHGAGADTLATDADIATHAAGRI